jgi:hypothetical protein
VGFLKTGFFGVFKYNLFGLILRQVAAQNGPILASKISSGKDFSPSQLPKGLKN